jgi:hypothetical protein
VLLAAMSLAVLLAACEDEGNPGDDNLLTGASLVVVVIIVAVIAWFVRSAPPEPIDSVGETGCQRPTTVGHTFLPHRAPRIERAES